MSKSKDTEYRERTDTNPSKQTGNINERTNNTAAATPGGEPDVEQASNEGIADAAANDQTMTKFNANSSANA